jgi:putative ABC transport system permease protein
MVKALLSLAWVPTALNRKLVRDLVRLWSQALTIALVVASGIGGFLTSLSAVDSLALARERFYAQGRFADVFASVKRAPAALADRLRDVPGVADVQTTVEQLVRVRIEGLPDPILGRLIGLEAREPLRMNRVIVRTGQAPTSRAPRAATATSTPWCRPALPTPGV